MRDDDDYKPSQNLHTDDERPPEQDDDVTLERLRREALGSDDDQDDRPDNQVDDDELDLAPDTDEDDQTDADDAEGGDIELAFESVDELADLVGMDVEDFLSRVKVRQIVDGEVREITLAEQQKGYQLESSFTRKNQAFHERQKAAEAEIQEERTRVADHFAKATTMLNMAQEQLLQDFNNVNWLELETNNPAEWTKKRQQFGERQARLNQAMARTTEQIKAARAEQEQQTAAAQERRLEAEHEALMAAVPAWKKDEARKEKEGRMIAEYLVKMGFHPDELDSLTDHRLILLGRAALGLAGPNKQKLDLAKKKINKVQNLVRSGNGQSRRAQGNAAFTKKAQEAKQELKRSGTTDAAAQAILARKLARAASAKRGRRSRV